MSRSASKEKRQSVIEKIRLLFNRAEHAVSDADDTDSVDHEAQLALETARRLMLQYGIEEAELEGVASKGKSSTEGSAMVVELTMRKPAEWVLSLAFTVANYFMCKPLYMPAVRGVRAAIIFCGAVLSAEASAYAYHSVLNQIRVLSRRYKVDRRYWEQSWIAQSRFRTFEEYSAQAKSEYCIGIVSGLTLRLKELQEQEMAEAQKESVTSLAISYSTIADEIALRINPDKKETDPPKKNRWTGDSHLNKGISDSKKVHVTRGLEAHNK